MENLTNEQIVNIIEFYKLCGISEDVYLSKKGVLDIFSLLGIEPLYDEEGNRIPTVYEDLGVIPKFDNGKEVPIVFAIKHKVSKIHRLEEKDKKSFKFAGAKELADDRVILNKLKQDYFSAVANGNMNEATRLYDIIDKITGGKADEFIGVFYNYVKFYKKMKEQLMLDIFANFIILRVLNQKQMIKNGVVKFDKLYKAFIESQKKNGNLKMFGGKGQKLPELTDIKIVVAEDDKPSEKTKIVISQKKSKEVIEIPKTEEQKSETGLVSFIKTKVCGKIKKIKEHLFFTSSKEKSELEEKQNKKSQKPERASRVLEND